MDKTEPTLTEATIYVKYFSGTYTTNTVHGRRASSTSSAEQAARKLADKLFGPERGPVEETSEGTTFVRRFRASGVLVDLVRTSKGTGKVMHAVNHGQAIEGDGTGAKLPAIRLSWGAW